MRKISIIIPVLNEEDQIEICLSGLQELRSRGHEVIVIDGESTDNTQVLAMPFAYKTIQHEKGRARQMNAGTKKTGGDILLFLHADTRLPQDADKHILAAIKESEHCWGYFNVQLSGAHWLFRIIERCMNLRSWTTGIATGDHAIFMTRWIYEEVGGYEEIELMEDIAVSSKLNQIVKPVSLREKVITSSRRWEQNGIIRTIFKMWRLRLAYFIGVTPATLVKQYD